MRLYKLGAVILMLIFVLTGCGKKVTSQVNTHPEIKKKIIFSSNRDDRADALNNLSKEFIKKNPDTIIEFEFPKNFERIYKARLAVNELPDITATSKITSDAGTYFSPLNDLGFSSDSFAVAIPLINGKIYGIPISVDCDGIIYNKAAFKNTGIVKTPETLKELYDVCKKLKEKNIIPLAINAKDKWPTELYVRRYPKMLLDNPNYDAELVNKDFLSSDSPVVSILNTLRDMNQKGYLEPDLTQTDWSQMKKDMAQGKIAMTFLGSWFVQQLIDNGAKPEDIGMFPFPGVKSIFLGNDYLYAVNKKSKYVDVAKAFMKYAWEESRISKAVGQASPFKNSKNNLEQINELLSFNIPSKCMNADESIYNNVINASGIDVSSLCFEYILSDHPEDVIKEYNEKWMTGKEKVNKNIN